MKILFTLQILAFVVVLLSASTIALGLANEAMVEVHKAAGGIFILFILLHLYIFRHSLKRIYSRRCCRREEE